MRGDEVVARKCGAPLALAASDEYGLAPFVGEPVEAGLTAKSVRRSVHGDQWIFDPIFHHRLPRHGVSKNFA
jgi:hypothetical protein